MDYENALMEDFESESDTSDIHMENEPELVEEKTKTSDSSSKPSSLRELLEQSRNTTIEQRLQQLDGLSTTDLSQLSNVKGMIPQIRAELAKYADRMDTEFMDLIASISQQSHSAEYSFLVQLSDLPVLINEEIGLLKKAVAARYKVVFPELETLVANPVDYCRIVREIGQDLIGIRAHEPSLKAIVSSEKVFTIVMAALQQFAAAFELSTHDMNSIIEACGSVIELNSFLQEISDFIAGKLSKYAPNVSAIVGPVVTSQLLISIGSLSQLAQTPSCNLPSFGVRDLSSQKARSGLVRATGYIYQCPLVMGLPPEVVKQALRIISGKVVLAARIDLSRSSPQGEMGRAYLKEIETKLDKLLAPPELTATKALPVPKEQKSKKRGGRRFRKMKERFQMSELRKAQNKMSFATQETTVVDTFGEEIGLGMSKHMDGISVNRNTDARMSKAMVGRLQSQKERESLDTIILAPGKRAREEDVGDVAANVGANVGAAWGTMKRQKVEDEI
ncbi:hypothetical protein OXX79_011034 [Metschnikowia pulcherrima]